MINNFRERSNILKCLYADILFHWNYDGKSSADAHNRKEIFKIRFPVSSIVTLFILTKQLELFSSVNPSSENSAGF